MRKLSQFLGSGTPISRPVVEADFAASLVEEAEWNRSVQATEIYAGLFPGGSREINDPSTGGSLADQLRGVDSYVYFGDRLLTVDDKAQKPKYSDSILIEQFSSIEAGSPGWSVDDKKDNDCVLYVWIPSNLALLVSREEVYQASVEWCKDDRYPLRRVPNKGYTTGVKYIPHLEFSNHVKCRWWRDGKLQQHPIEG